MRKSIIMGAAAGMLAAALPSQAWSAPPNWVSVGTDSDGYTTYVDLNSMQRSGAIVRYWKRVQFPDHHPVVEKLLGLWEENCVTRQGRVLQSTGYYRDGRGPITNGEAGAWEYIVPDTIGQRALDFVCRR